MQWLQNPKQSTVDNLNNIRRENNRNIRNKNKDYLQVIIDELETQSKTKNACKGASKGLKSCTKLELM